MNLEVFENVTLAQVKAKCVDSEMEEIISCGSTTESNEVRSSVPNGFVIFRVSFQRV